MALSDDLNALATQLNSSTAEIKAKIDELEVAIYNQGDVAGALANLREAVNANDAIVVPAEPPAPAV